MVENDVRQLGREGESGISRPEWLGTVVLMIIVLLVTAVLTYLLVPPLDATNPTAHILTTKGEIVVELRPDAAPQHVENFIELARSGFYEGLTFHRVEPGFVIQGGDPDGDGSGGPGYTVPAEIALPHRAGALAAARQADSVNPERASSGSQFYITLAPQPGLDGQYTVYGYVTAGMDAVQQIEVGDVIQRVDVE